MDERDYIAMNKDAQKGVLPIFATEQDAIDWVEMNLPILVKKEKSNKYGFPFTSLRAYKICCVALGEKLFKLIQK